MTMLPDRERQALREVGRTAISAPASWTLVLLFLVTVASVGFLGDLGDERFGRQKAGGRMREAGEEEGEEEFHRG